jgi:AraC-like DNA-binding protein
MDSTRGILAPAELGRKFELSRRSPASDVARFVENYWSTRWDLTGQPPYTAEILSFPCVHVVFERGRSRIYGVITSKFTRVLEGRGQAFGVKFRPAGFYPFVHLPVAALTDGQVRIDDVFGVDPRHVEDALLALADDDAKYDLVEDIVRAHLPPWDDAIATIDAMVACVSGDRSVIRVDQVVERFGLNKRTLQRLFKQYVGVTPKWVIKRFRLHEAAERLAAGEDVDVPRLAIELGYFDQAHFIKDFKSIVGQSPGQYARTAKYV